MQARKCVAKEWRKACNLAVFWPNTASDRRGRREGTGR